MSRLEISSTTASSDITPIREEQERPAQGIASSLSRPERVQSDSSTGILKHLDSYNKPDGVDIAPTINGVDIPLTLIPTTVVDQPALVDPLTSTGSMQAPTDAVQPVDEQKIEPALTRPWMFAHGGYHAIFFTDQVDPTERLNDFQTILKVRNDPERDNAWVAVDTEDGRIVLRDLWVTWLCYKNTIVFLGRAGKGFEILYGDGMLEDKQCNGDMTWAVDDTGNIHFACRTRKTEWESSFQDFVGSFATILSWGSFPIVMYNPIEFERKGWFHTLSTVSRVWQTRVGSFMAEHLFRNRKDSSEFLYLNLFERDAQRAWAHLSSLLPADVADKPWYLCESPNYAGSPIRQFLLSFGRNTWTSYAAYFSSDQGIVMYPLARGKPGSTKAYLFNYFESSFCYCGYVIQAQEPTVNQIRAYRNTSYARAAWLTTSVMFSVVPVHLHNPRAIALHGHDNQSSTQGRMYRYKHLSHRSMNEEDTPLPRPYPAVQDTNSATTTTTTTAGCPTPNAVLKSASKSVIKSVAKQNEEGCCVM